MKNELVRDCMIVFSYYPIDPRVRREAEALAEAGFQTDVICLRQPGESRTELINGVRVYRMPLSRQRTGYWRYIWQYAYFFILSSLFVSFLHLRKRYQIIHVHNMPEVLVFGALVPWLTGARIVLDLHDPTPEVFMARFLVNESNLTVRFLQFLERASIRIAQLVLTPNTATRKLFISRGCPDSKIHVVMNSPEEKIFQPSSDRVSGLPAHSDQFVLMYHGTITKRNGLATALKAVAHVRHQIPKLRLDVYGNGDFVDEFLRQVKELGLSDIVSYHGLVSAERIAVAIRSIDLGLIPNEVSKQWDLATPTRVFEYLCLGKPVVVPRTRGIQDYFDQDSMHFFEPGDPLSLADAIYGVYKDPLRTRAVVERGMSVHRAHRWELEKRNLIGFVTALVDS